MRPPVVVPGSTQGTPLWQCGYFTSGAGFPHDHQGEDQGDLPFCKVADLSLPENSDAIVTANNWVSGDVAATLGAPVIPPGSVVFPKIGAALLNNLRRQTQVPTCIDNNVVAFTPTVGDRRYWYYWWSVADVRPLANPGPVPSLNLARLSQTRVSLPESRIQRRIADVLDAETARIDTLIEKNNEAQRLAETKLREEIATAVTHGPEGSSRPVTGSSWAHEVNGSWDWAPYQYFAELGSGHTPSRSRGDLWENCTIPWVTTADVKHLRDHRREYLEETVHHLSEAGLAHSAARLLPARTVVLSRTASVGFSAIMAKPMATSQDFFTWTSDEGRLLGEYLLYVLRAMKFRGHFDRLMYGSTHQTIYFPDLVQLRGPVPPVPEQRAVVEYIRKRSGPVHRLVDRVQRTNELLRLRRQALITAAVTGEIEV